MLRLMICIAIIMLLTACAQQSPIDRQAAADAAWEDRPRAWAELNRVNLTPTPAELAWERGELDQNWWRKLPEAGLMLSSGEAVVACAKAGRVTFHRKDGAPISIADPARLLMLEMMAFKIVQNHHFEPSSFWMEGGGCHKEAAMPFPTQLPKRVPAARARAPQQTASLK